MDIRKNVEKSDRSSNALVTFLESVTSPAFGALPKSEIELLILELLIEVDSVSSDPSEYELVSKLRVTRSKARKLIYERELRRSSPDDLDKMMKEVLKRPLIQKSGDLFILEVENPLVSDHLRAATKRLGFVSDGSFQPSIVKLSGDAIAAVVEDSLGKNDTEKVRLALIKAGAPDTSFAGVFKAVASKLASKAASKAGEALVDEISDTVGPILEGAAAKAGKAIKGLFDADDK